MYLKIKCVIIIIIMIIIKKNISVFLAKCDSDVNVYSNSAVLQRLYTKHTN